MKDEDKGSSDESLQGCIWGILFLVTQKLLSSLLVMEHEHSKDAQALICEYISLSGSSPAPKPGLFFLQLLGHIVLVVCAGPLALGVSRHAGTQPLLGNGEHWEHVCSGNTHPATWTPCPALLRALLLCLLNAEHSLCQAQHSVSWGPHADPFSA